MPTRDPPFRPVTEWTGTFQDGVLVGGLLGFILGLLFDPLLIPAANRVADALHVIRLRRYRSHRGR